MRKRFPLLFRRSVLGMLVAVNIFAPLAGATTGFESNVSPDPADISGTGNGHMGYAVSTANYIGTDETHLRVYAKTNELYLFVAAADVCQGEVTMLGIKDNWHDASDNGHIQHVGMNDELNKFVLKGGGGNTDEAIGRKRNNSYCTTAASQTQFPGVGDSKSAPLAGTTKRLRVRSNNPVAGLTGVYRFDFDAKSTNYCGGNKSTRCYFNSFRLKALHIGSATHYGGGNDIWFSQDTTANADQFALNPGRAEGYYNYHVNFGPDCSVPAGGKIARIRVYDDDNLNQNFIQRTWDPFRVQVERRARSGGSWEGIGLSRSSSAWGNNSTQPNEHDGNANNGPGNSTKRNYMIHGSDNIYVVGTDASKQTIDLQFNVHPQFIYRFRIYKVWYHNNIQYQMPYEAVWGDPANVCQVNVQPIVTMPATATVGSTVTPTFRVRNNAPPSTGYDGSVDYQRKLWLAVNQNDTVDAGESVIRSEPWQGPLAINNGSDVIVSSAGWSTVAATGSRYICASLQLRPNGTGTVIGTPNPDVACTPISKFPSMAVTAGDLRTGGAFNAPTCSVNRPSLSAVQQDRYFGAVMHDYGSIAPSPRHSFVRHAILTTGNAYNIVSNRLVPGGVSDMTLSFAWDGSSTQSGSFHGNLPGGSGAFNTHCLSPVFTPGRYPAPALTVPIAGNQTRNITPGAGVTTIQYNVANDSDLTLRGPGGGPLVLNPGQKVIVRVVNTGTGNSRVRLGSNIEYAGVATSISALPQFVLLVGSGPTSNIDIRVDQGVSRLDGIFANQGTNNTTAAFHTCTTKAESPTGDISAAQCAGKLTVNGAIILGSRLNPYRTFGHDVAGNADPAEEFRLRPDTVLGDYARGTTSSKLEVIGQKELAPRF